MKKFLLLSFIFLASLLATDKAQALAGPSYIYLNIDMQTLGLPADKIEVSLVDLAAYGYEADWSKSKQTFQDVYNEYKNNKDSWDSEHNTNFSELQYWYISTLSDVRGAKPHTARNLSTCYLERGECKMRLDSYDKLEGPYIFVFENRDTEELFYKELFYINWEKIGKTEWVSI